MQKFLIVIFLLFALDSMAQFGSNRATKTDEIQSNTTSNIILNPTTDVILDNLTGNTVPYLNGSKAIKSSSVTDTELGYLSGVTSSIQTQLNAKVDDATTITTTSPLFIDGIGSADLSANRTLSIQQATSLLSGFLSSTDWNTFNNKVSATRSISTTSPLTGGGDLSADRTISIPQSSGSQDGYLSSTDWATFNNKFTSPLTTKGDLLTRDNSSHIRFPVGADGKILSANSAQTSGLEWIDPPATSPLTTEGDLYYYTTQDDRLPIGTNNQLLKVNTSVSGKMEWFTPSYFTPSGSITDNCVLRSDGTTNVAQCGAYDIDDSGNLTGVDGIFYGSVNSNLLFDIGSSTTKAVKPFTVLTTTERNALTPQTNSYIHNTTDNALQWYNGTSWANVGGGITSTQYNNSKYHVLATNSGSQSCTDDVAVKANFATEVRDTASVHSAGDITIPANGVCTFCFMYNVTPPATGYRYEVLLYEGASIALRGNRAYSAGGSGMSVHSCWTVPVVSGEVYSLRGIYGGATTPEPCTTVSFYSASCESDL